MSIHNAEKLEPPRPETSGDNTKFLYFAGTSVDDVLKLKPRLYWKIGRDIVGDLSKIKDAQGIYIVGFNIYGNLTLLGHDVVVVDGGGIEHCCEVGS